MTKTSHKTCSRKRFLRYASRLARSVIGRMCVSSDCLRTVSSAVPRETRPAKERVMRVKPGVSKTFEGFLQTAIDEVGVNLGSRDVAVAEGALDDQQVARRLVKVGGESVPQSVGRERLGDARLAEPVPEPEPAPEPELDPGGDDPPGAGLAPADWSGADLGAGSPWAPLAPPPAETTFPALDPPAPAARPAPPAPGFRARRRRWWARRPERKSCTCAIRTAPT